MLPARSSMSPADGEALRALAQRVNILCWCAKRRVVASNQPATVG